jgi:two-component system OmpR family sensor kinase
VARDAAAEAAPLASGHPVSFDLQREVTVEGAADDLHRMALNLIENAVVHTPSGTPVTVSVRAEDGTALLEVSDRGPGVPDRLRERVFERFSRGGGDSGAGNGSGLGLAIVRAVAEAHDGSVELDDADGGGARFRVHLPRTAASAPPGARRAGDRTRRVLG